MRQHVSLKLPEAYTKTRRIIPHKIFLFIFISARTSNLRQLRHFASLRNIARCIFDVSTSCCETGDKWIGKLNEYSVLPLVSHRNNFIKSHLMHEVNVLGKWNKGIFGSRIPGSNESVHH
jgi:hypothetical protein